MPVGRRTESQRIVVAAMELRSGQVALIRSPIDWSRYHEIADAASNRRTLNTGLLVLTVTVW